MTARQWLDEIKHLKGFLADRTSNSRAYGTVVVCRRRPSVCRLSVAKL